MKKKVLALILCAMMAATAVVGGTLAYFTDTDYNKNVMVTGNVKIDQIEQQRKDNKGDLAETNLEDFTDNKQMFPVTADITTEDTDRGYFNDPNVVDKFVSVENTGNSPAFVRTIFAFEMGKEGEGENVTYKDIAGSHVRCLVTTNKDGSLLAFDALKEGNNNEYVTVDVGDTKYIVGVYYYNDNTVEEDGVIKKSALAKEEVSNYSLRQVWLRSSIGNDFYDLVGDEYDILVMSQAVQTEGFTDAKTALDTAFGAITDTNVKEWFDNSDYTNSHDKSADAAETPAPETTENP